MQTSSKRALIVLLIVIAIGAIAFFAWRYWSSRPDSRLEDGTPVYGLSVDDKQAFAEELKTIPEAERTLTAEDKESFLDLLTQVSQ